MAALLVLVLAAAAPGRAQEDEILGVPAAPGLSDSEERVTLGAGSVLRALPDPREAIIASVDTAVELPVVERRGDWVRVRLGSLKGWFYTGSGTLPERPLVDPPPPGEPEEAPVDIADLQAVEEPGADRRRRVHELLGEAGREVALGPFAMLTDLPAEVRLGRIPVVAERLHESFRERYGMEPGVGPAGTVVLFRTEEAYRRFEAEDVAVAELGLDGHASSDLAALFLGDRTPEEVQPLLIHELTHLLNRRVFTTTPPPWLEEGMANDLAYSQADREGRLVAGTVGGRATESRRVVRLSGPNAALSRLAKAAGQARLTPLAELTDYSWSEFQRPEGRPLRYAESAFFLRYLLDADRGRHAGTARTWIAQVARRGTAAAPELADALGVPWAELDAGYAAWLRTQSPWSTP